MTTSLEVVRAPVSELALRLVAVRGTAAYAAYLVAAGAVGEVIAELGEELRALDPSLAVAALAPTGGEPLVREVAASTSEAVLVDASALGEVDWALVDRRRSAIAHPGVLVVVMPHEGFDALMNAAPNLASWLGALVFAHAGDELQQSMARDRRLTALRAWAQQSDDEVVRLASRGELPADPEYAEWLVMLGRGDLLDRTP